MTVWVRVRVCKGVGVCVVCVRIRVCDVLVMGGCPCVSEEELRGTGAQGPVS